MPLVLLRLLVRARRDRGYCQHVKERLALGLPRPPAPCIWVHAVSVGETRAAQPLIEALLAAYPAYTIVLTHMTPTGRRTGAAIFAQALSTGRLRQMYLPYDMLVFIRHFFRRLQPMMGLLMETEVWPSMVWQAQKQAIPLVLVNARMSARSLRRALHFGEVAQKLFSAIPLALAQTEEDAHRLRCLGMADVRVCGNLKFDMPVPMEHIQQGKKLRAYIGVERHVFCAASTRIGEEKLILEAWVHLQKQFLWAYSAVLILVPRHPERASEIAEMVRQYGLKEKLRSHLPTSVLSRADVGPAVPSVAESIVQAGVQQPYDLDTQVLIGDTLGEMALYYSACDCALIGGGLLPYGGQNLIEACALGKPTLLGPHMFNFSQVSIDAIQAGAARQLTEEQVNPQELSHAIGRFFNEHGQTMQMSAAALKFAQTYRGASTIMMQALRPLIA